MVNEKHKQLHTAFRMVLASFAVADILGKDPQRDKMSELTKSAIAELEKEQPCPRELDSIVREMQELATVNSRIEPVPYAKGGIVVNP
jgi:hypothetical protein